MKRLSLLFLLTVIVTTALFSWYLRSSARQEPFHRSEVAESSDTPPPEPLSPQAPPVSTALPVSTPMPAEHDFQALPGQQFHFTLQTQWLSSFAAVNDTAQPSKWIVAATGPSSSTLDLSAVLQVTVLAYEPPYFLLHFHLHDLRLSGGSPENPTSSLLTSLSQPVLVRFHHDGRVLGYRFPSAMPANVQRHMATVATLSHQFVAGRDTRTIAGLRDEIGVFTARFTWGPSQLLGRRPSPVVRTRTVLHYASLGEPEQPGPEVQVTHSLSEASFADGWIARAQAQEARESVFMDTLHIVSQVSLQMERTSITTVAVDPTAARALAGPWRFPAATEADETPDAEERLSPEEAQRRATAVLAELDKLVRSGEFATQDALEAWLELARLVHAQPQAVLSKLSDQLRADDLDTVTAGLAITAIGKAGGHGTPEAVTLLSDLLGDPTTTADQKLAVVLATHQLGPYAGPIITDLQSLLQQTEDGGLAPEAALALGTLAGDPGLAEAGQSALREALAGVYDLAYERGEPELFFGALANTEKPDLIAEALSYLDDVDIEVRLAALEALPAMGDDLRAAEVLITKAQMPIESVDVRRTAIEGLGQVPEQPATLAALQQLVTTEPDESLRLEAVHSLGRLAQQDGSAAAPLLEQARHDGSPAVSNAASTSLAGLKQRYTSTR